VRLAAPVRRSLERAYWWWMLRTSRVADVDGLRFIFIGSRDGAGREACREVLAEAVATIRAGGGGFGELVLSHLRFVAAVDHPTGWVAVSAKGFVCPFGRRIVESSRLLACRLVWAATVVRLARDAMASAEAPSPQALARAAEEVQQRFLSQFPASESWTQYLRDG
jgi:hypothetical protein